MINEFEFFHGVVFARLLHGTQQTISVRTFQSVSNASYVVNNDVGIYIKYSTKRMTPWRFTFHKIHQEEFDALNSRFPRVFLLLVCNDDGVVCLSYPEVKKILDNQHDPIEWISATRRKREMYSIRGSDGQLDCKIGKSDFPRKLFGLSQPIKICRPPALD